jgi:hypothetical protein
MIPRVTKTGLTLGSSGVGAAGRVTGQSQTKEHENKTKTKSTAYRLFLKTVNPVVE